MSGAPPPLIQDYVTSKTSVRLDKIRPGNVYKLKPKPSSDLLQSFKDIATNQYQGYLVDMVDTEYDTLQLGYTRFSMETFIDKLNAGLNVYYNGSTVNTRADGVTIPKSKFNYYDGDNLAYNSERKGVIAYYSIPNAFLEILDIFPVTEHEGPVTELDIFPVTEPPAQTSRFAKFKRFFSLPKGGKKSIKRNKIKGNNRIRRRFSVRRKKTTRRKHN